MGHCGYYCRFIYMYAIITKPLYALLIVFEWTHECEEAFEKLKKALITAPILKPLDWNKVFHVHIDASTYAIGCILAQPHEHNMDFPVSYASKQLSDAKKNYTTMEREGLAIVYNVKKFRHYLLANHFIFFSDHHALLYLVNKPCAIGRIVRWFVILLEFDFSVAIRPGSTHQRADHLSRIMSGEAPMGVKDNLPDSTLFLVETAPRWAESIIEVLTSGFAKTKGLTFEAIDELFHYKPYVLISRKLYKRGLDGILCLCIGPEEYALIIKNAHIS